MFFYNIQKDKIALDLPGLFAHVLRPSFELRDNQSS